MTDSAPALHIVCPHCHTTTRVAQVDLSNAPDCGQCHHALFTAHPVALDEAAFAHLIGADLLADAAPGAADPAAVSGPPPGADAGAPSHPADRAVPAVDQGEAADA